MKLPRWMKMKWWYVVFIFAPSLYFALVTIIASFITGEDADSLMDKTVLYVGVPLMAWLVWACPVLEAGVSSKHMRKKPLRFRRRLRLIVWVPAIIGMPIVIMIIALMIIALMIRLPLELLEQRLILIAVIGPPVFLIGSWLVDRLVCRRFNDTLRSMKICVACGYDLRASPGPTCPECGEVIPQSSEVVRD